MLIYAVLVVAGIFSIYAASYDFDHASIFSLDEVSGKQIMWVGVSLFVGFVIFMIDARMFEAYAYPVYLAIVLLLLVTVFVAPDVKGSHSWLVITSSLRIQPAEFAKFATALALAKLFSTYNFRLNDSPGNYYKALAIIFVPLVLIIMQKETGSALVFTSLFFVLYREGMSGLVLLAALCAVTFFVVAIKYAEPLFLGIPLGHAIVLMLVMALMVLMLGIYCKSTEAARNVFLGFAASGLLVGIVAACGYTLNGYLFFAVAIVVAVVYIVYMSYKGRVRHAAMLIGAVVGSILFMFSANLAFDVLKPYQQQRVRDALGIMEDPKGWGYNVNQSKIAIGSGGIAGKGFLNGTQTKLKYVPEQHTDFIFCTIGEEEGFVGAALVLAAFLALILRVISIAERQPTIFGRVYGYCVASYFIFHLCVNVGMVIGLCPVIGIPLPFFSYGGSSLLGFTISLFILLRIDAARREHLAY